jgi:hypothetical protein
MEPRDPSIPRGPGVPRAIKGSNKHATAR